MLLSTQNVVCDPTEAADTGALGTAELDGRGARNASCCSSSRNLVWKLNPAITVGERLITLVGRAGMNDRPAAWSV